MLKKTITYVDFNGKETTEDFYFNLSKPEITKLAFKYGNLKEYIQKVVANDNVNAMIAFFEDLILSSYGIKSEDGKRFVKGEQVKLDFEYSQAYAELFEILLTSPSESLKFGEGLVSNPSDRKQKAEENVHNLDD